MHHLQHGVQVKNNMAQASDQEESSAKLSFRLVPATKAGSDAGSRARMDLSYFECCTEYGWLMLGHSYDAEVTLVNAESQYVRQAEGWKKVWSMVSVSTGYHYSVWLPTCRDEDFVALGVVCVFGTDEESPGPAEGYPVALVHKSMCEPCSPGPTAWTDAGTGAPHDLTLATLPHHCMWPTVSTFAPCPAPYTVGKI